MSRKDKKSSGDEVDFNTYGYIPRPLFGEKPSDEESLELLTVIEGSGSFGSSPQQQNKGAATAFRTVASRIRSIVDQVIKLIRNR